MYQSDYTTCYSICYTSCFVQKTYVLMWATEWTFCKSMRAVLLVKYEIWGITLFHTEKLIKIIRLRILPPVKQLKTHVHTKTCAVLFTSSKLATGSNPNVHSLMTG